MYRLKRIARPQTDTVPADSIEQSANHAAEVLRGQSEVGAIGVRAAKLDV